MKNSIKDIIKSGISLLKNPNKELKLLQNKSLEEVVGNYMRLLLLLALVAALFNFVISLVKLAFLDITRSLTVNYSIFFNYALSESAAYIFSYVLAGTFLVFIMSILIKIFFKKMKYTDFLKIFLYSLYPILLFSWSPYFLISLSIWSIFLFLTGVRAYRLNQIKSTSIGRRE